MNFLFIKFIYGDMVYYKVGFELLYILIFICLGYEGLFIYIGFFLY